MRESGLRTLADLGQSHCIVAICDRCEHTRRLHTGKLIAVYGRQLSIEELRRRLACSRCRYKPASIRIVYTLPSR